MHMISQISIVRSICFLIIVYIMQKVFLKCTISHKSLDIYIRNSKMIVPTTFFINAAIKKKVTIPDGDYINGI